MNSIKIAAISALALATTLPAIAAAQESSAETVYMRRPLPLTPSTTAEGFRWETTSTVTDLNGNPVDEASYCGPIIRRNESICVAIADGRRVGDSYCGSTTRPDSEEEDYASGGCTFSWFTTPWDEGGPSCTASEYQTRSVSCQNQNGETVADRFCTGTRPASARNVADYSGCTGDDPSSTPTVRWGAWTYDQTCSATATKTRRGTCQVDGQNVSDNVCTDIGIALTESVQEPNYAGCSYAWQTESWSAWSTTCGTGTRTRSVTCQRSNGSTVADTYCSANPKPRTSETSSITSGCGSPQCTSVNHAISGDTCEGGTVIATGEYHYDSRDNSEQMEGMYDGRGQDGALACIRAGGNCYQEHRLPHYEYGEWNEEHNYYECHAGATSISPNGSYDGMPNTTDPEDFEAGFLTCASLSGPCDEYDPMYDGYGGRVWVNDPGEQPQTYVDQCAAANGTCYVTVQTEQVEHEQAGSWEVFETACYKEQNGSYTTVFNDEWDNHN